MTNDPAILLDWMHARGPGDIPARAISDAGPRVFRRKPESEAALAALIERGAIIEVAARPRVFRIVEAVTGIPAAPANDADLAPAAEQEPTDKQSIPSTEIRELLATRTAWHDANGLSDNAARYMAARDVFDALTVDPRIAPVQIAADRCHVCSQGLDGTTLRVGIGRVPVHARCLGEHRAAIAARIDTLVVSAIEDVGLRQSGLC